MQIITEFQGQYRWLSNFWPCYITVWGQVFTSVEHAYQAAKFPQGSAEFRAVQSVVSPGLAKRVARSYTANPRSLTEQCRLSTMSDAVRAKFTQNEDLRAKLIATGDAWLEEGNRWGDRFWGICPPGTDQGQNHLGVMLMAIRKELQ